MSKRFDRFCRLILLLLIFSCLVMPGTLRAGNEEDAYAQLQKLTENLSADQVKPLEDALGGAITPAQLLDGMRTIESIQSGDWKNASENSAELIIGLFSSTFGGYLEVHKAAREAATAVIENWVQDLYAHPAYKGIVHVLNRMVIDSAKLKTPYLPSYLCGRYPDLKSEMQLKEGIMYQKWIERPEYSVENLTGTGPLAARLRQVSKRGDLSDRDIFNAFLVKAVQDQKSFILTTFQRVAMQEGAREARDALKKRAGGILAKIKAAEAAKETAELNIRASRVLIGDQTGHYALTPPEDFEPPFSVRVGGDGLEVNKAADPLRGQFHGVRSSSDRTHTLSFLLKDSKGRSVRGTTTVTVRGLDARTIESMNRPQQTIYATPPSRQPEAGRPDSGDSGTSITRKPSDVMENYYREKKRIQDEEAARKKAISDQYTRPVQKPATPSWMSGGAQGGQGRQQPCRSFTIDTSPCLNTLYSCQARCPASVGRRGCFDQCNENVTACKKRLCPGGSLAGAGSKLTCTVCR